MTPPKILGIFLGLVFFMLLILSIILWASSGSKLTECSSDDQDKIAKCAQGVFALCLISIAIACLMFFEIIDYNKIYIQIILSIIGLLLLILGSIIYGTLNSNCNNTSNVQSLQTESEIIFILGILIFIIFSARAVYLYYYGTSGEVKKQEAAVKDKQLYIKDTSKVKYQNPLEELLLAEEQEEANQKEALIQAKAALEIARNNNDALAVRRANIRLKNIENEILKKELEKEIKIQAEEDAIELQKAKLKRGRVGIEQVKPTLTTSPTRPKAISEDVKKILMDAKERSKKEEDDKRQKLAAKANPDANAVGPANVKAATSAKASNQPLDVKPQPPDNRPKSAQK